MIGRQFESAHSLLTNYSIVTMTNLSKFTTPKFEYDWNLIDDSMDRQAAKSAVETYEKSHALRVAEAEELVKEDNLAKSKCVFTLKQTLGHGQFLDVCQQALGLNSTTASALASTGRLLMEGDHSEEVEAMVRVMEPRAANKFLRSDDETKLNHVVQFEETGKVPSCRDFESKPFKVSEYQSQQPKKMHDYEAESPIQQVSPTYDKWSAKDRIVQHKIRLSDACGAMTLMLKEISSCKDETKAVLAELKSELDRLLK